MRKTVVCQLALGMTRVSGYVLYDHETMAFEECTPKVTLNLVKKNLVNGLILNDSGEIVLDQKGFNCKNLMVKSGVGKYRPIKDGTIIRGNVTYSLTKVADTDNGLVYEVVSNQCARLPFTEKTLRLHYAMNNVYGCWIDDNTDMITFADGVEFVDMTSDGGGGWHNESDQEAAAAKEAGYEWDTLGDWADNKEPEDTQELFGSGETNRQMSGKNDQE